MPPAVWVSLRVNADGPWRRLGPQVVLIWERQRYVETGLDLPLLPDNTAVQIVPDYRIHGSVG